MEFYMAGSTSGLGRRPLKAETCVRITYLSPIWPLGQGKVVYLSDRKRWFAYHQRSPFMVAWTRESRPLLRREAVARMPPAITIYPLHKVHCVKSLPFTQVGRLFGVFQLSSSGGLSETGKLTRGLVVCFRPSTKKEETCSPEVWWGSSSRFHRAFEHKRCSRSALDTWMPFASV